MSRVDLLKALSDRPEDIVIGYRPGLSGSWVKFWIDFKESIDDPEIIYRRVTRERGDLVR